jgi:hypothetical protein
VTGVNAHATLLKRRSESYFEGPMAADKPIITPDKLPPIFVRANLSFRINNEPVSFLNQYVSSFGISGIRWAHLDPTEHLGEQLLVQVDVLCKDRFKFLTDGGITTEYTTDVTYFGIRFHLKESDEKRLARAIQNEGTYPTQYLRKYPRIPAQARISTVPMLAIAQAPDKSLIVFSIANISPTGLLLYTENQVASVFLPGDRIWIQIEPRGDLLNSFKLEGLICRVMMDKNPETQNINRYLGIRITHLNDKDRQNFLDILRTVLNNLKVVD